MVDVDRGVRKSLSFGPDKLGVDLLRVDAIAGD